MWTPKSFNSGVITIVWSSAFASLIVTLNWTLAIRNISDRQLLCTKNIEKVVVKPRESLCTKVVVLDKGTPWIEYHILPYISTCRGVIDRPRSLFIDTIWIEIGDHSDPGSRYLLGQDFVCFRKKRRQSVAFAWYVIENICYLLMIISLVSFTGKRPRCAGVFNLPQGSELQKRWLVYRLGRRQTCNSNWEFHVETSEYWIFDARQY